MGAVCVHTYVDIWLSWGPYQRDFIALRKFRAPYAVRPDFVRQEILVHKLEAKSLEQTLSVSENEHLFHAHGPGFFH